jgi:hypothetical protein
MEIVFRLITVYPYFDWKILKDFSDGKKDPEEVLYEIAKHAYERTRHSRGYYYYYDKPIKRQG